MVSLRLVYYRFTTDLYDVFHHYFLGLLTDIQLIFNQF